MRHWGVNVFCFFRKIVLDLNKPKKNKKNKKKTFLKYFYAFLYFYIFFVFFKNRSRPKQKTKKPKKMLTPPLDIVLIIKTWMITILVPFDLILKWERCIWYLIVLGCLYLEDKEIRSSVFLTFVHFKFDYWSILIHVCVFLFIFKFKIRKYVFQFISSKNAENVLHIYIILRGGSRVRKFDTTMLR